MPDYRRWRAEGGVFFFTVVTHQRQPIFSAPLALRLLRNAIAGVRHKRPFELRAIVLLPDHLHMLWRLPEGDAEYSTRMGLIKKRFTSTYLAAGGREGASTASRRKHRIRGVWQKRFIEHTIRDYADYKRHLDYIHANPVKHGLVSMPREWPHSSFHRHVRAGEYDLDWCGHVELPGGLNLEPEDWC
jgi:putative transposase